MVDVTILELHLEDASFSARAPFAGMTGEQDVGDDGGTAVDVEGETDEESSGPSRLLGLAMALGLAAVAAWRLRKRRSEQAEDVAVTQ